MQTRCPQCETIFRVGEEQLAVADGQVRCGECDAIFDARSQLVEEQPDRTDGANTAMQLDAVTLDPVELDRDAMQFDIPGLDIPSMQSAPTPTADSDEQTIPVSDDEPAPGDDTGAEVTTDTITGDDDTGPSSPNSTDAVAMDETGSPGEPTSTGKPKTGYNPRSLFPEFNTAPGIEVPGNPLLSVAAVVLALLLLLGLVGQYVYFERDKLARHTALRPWLGHLCQLLDCQLAALREPELVRLLRHEVHTHPTQPDALYIAAVIVNEAGASQAYPVMRVLFRDSDGRLLAQRDFLPDEYLPADVDQARGMIPGEPVNTLLELVDPGKKAVSYQFEFL